MALKFFPHRAGGVRVGYEFSEGLASQRLGATRRREAAPFEGEFLTSTRSRPLRTPLYRSFTLPLKNARGRRAMMDIMFIIGTLISVAMFAYGAYLAIHYALFHDRIETTATADELPEIGYYVRW